jgi:hypothetical protein
MIEIDGLKDVLLLILGWLLGLLAPAIVAIIRDKREARVIKSAVLTELHELQYRLVLVIYRVESKHGKLNQEFFKWAQSILTDYKGINSRDSLLKTIGPILKLTNDEISTLTQDRNHQVANGLSLKKLSLSLLDSSLASLSKFDPVLQGQLLEVKTHIGFMNEIVDDSRYYFRLSFQEGISPQNYEIANANMINSYKDYVVQGRAVIDIIGKILFKK